MMFQSYPEQHFYPRPPRGGRRWAERIYVLHWCNFYPRPPRGGRQRGTRKQTHDRHISIHALREEGDSCRFGIPPYIYYFYPRPPRGGRRLNPAGKGLQGLISIHALREEGDLDYIDTAPTIEVFLSTPSARRATLPYDWRVHA